MKDECGKVKFHIESHLLDRTVSHNSLCKFYMSSERKSCSKRVGSVATFYCYLQCYINDNVASIGICLATILSLPSMLFYGDILNFTSKLYCVSDILEYKELYNFSIWFSFTFCILFPHSHSAFIFQGKFACCIHFPFPFVVCYKECISY